MDLRRPAATPAQPTVDVLAMSIPAKIEESLRRSIPMMPAEAQQLAKSLITPKALTELATTLTIWATSQLIELGELADFVLLLASSMMLGTTALDTGKELLAFGSVVIEASTTEDLDKAAKHFTRAIALAGVTTVSAILLRKPVAAGSPSGLAVKTEVSAVEGVTEMPYARAVKTLDLNIIKTIVIDVWQQPGKWPVRVFALRSGQLVGDPVVVDGFITTEQSVLGSSLRELERRLGFEPGYLGDSAAIVRLSRLPTPPEFDLRFYNNIHGGGVKLSNPRFPLGPGYPQWELLQKVPARITHVITR